VIEVDERIGLPKLLTQLLAGNDVPTPSQQQYQDVERTAAKFEQPTLLPQLTGAAVDLEKAKPV
jgi:hypothetical protein